MTARTAPPLPSNAITSRAMPHATISPSPNPSHVSRKSSHFEEDEQYPHPQSATSHTHSTASSGRNEMQSESNFRHKHPASLSDVTCLHPRDRFCSECNFSVLPPRRNRFSANSQHNSLNRKAETTCTDGNNEKYVNNQMRRCNLDV